MGDSKEENGIEWQRMGYQEDEGEEEECKNIMSGNQG